MASSPSARATRQRAESLFQQTLKSNPDFADALLELANIRIAAKKYAEAEELLRRYVRVSRDPGDGILQAGDGRRRSLHETAAADRDLNVFKTLSKNASAGPLPYEHLFDYLDNRSKLAPDARDQLDVESLTDQTQDASGPTRGSLLTRRSVPESPANWTMPRDTIALSSTRLSSADYRTLTGTGVLLARYHLYDDAIQHFQAALEDQSQFR